MDPFPHIYGRIYSDGLWPIGIEVPVSVQDPVPGSYLVLEVLNIILYSSFKQRSAQEGLPAKEVMQSSVEPHSDSQMRA